MKRGTARLFVCVTFAVTFSQASGRDCNPDCDRPTNVPTLLQAAQLPIEIDQAMLQRQFDALNAMKLDKLEYSRLGPVKSLRGKTGIVLPADISERKEGDTADDILPLLKDILLAAGTESLSVGHDSSGPRGRSRRFEQRIRGLPVFNGFFGLEYDDLSKEISTVAAIFLPDRGLPEKPTVTAEWAEKQAFEIVSTRRLGCMPGPTAIIEGPALGYFADPKGMDRPRLVWLMRVQPDNEYVYLDANTGVLVRRFSPSIPLTPCPK